MSGYELGQLHKKAIIAQILDPTGIISRRFVAKYNVALAVYLDEFLASRSQRRRKDRRNERNF